MDGDREITSGYSYPYRTLRPGETFDFETNNFNSELKDRWNKSIRVKFTFDEVEIN
jgi:hypothetical protein